MVFSPGLTNLVNFKHEWGKSSFMFTEQITIQIDISKIVYCSEMKEKSFSFVKGIIK